MKEAGKTNQWDRCSTVHGLSLDADPHPCQRFAPALTGRGAWLGASVGHYSFTVEGFHLKPPAGLSAHPFIPSRYQPLLIRLART
jgi:hypothetical protein